MADDERGRVPEASPSRYWRTNLRIMALLLSVWFVASFVLGIILVEPLNAISLGGFPLGLWFAQQGSIYIFIGLILVYAVWMDRVDRRFTDAVRGSGTRS